MPEQNVRIEWGPFLSSCYIVLVDGTNYLFMLHIAGDLESNPSIKASEIVPGLAKFQNVEIALSEAQTHLPHKHDIAWIDELKGDPLLGYELRGAGKGFRVWIRAKGSYDGKALNPQEQDELLRELKSARKTFFV